MFSFLLRFKFPTITADNDKEHIPCLDRSYPLNTIYSRKQDAAIIMQRVVRYLLNS